MPTPHCIILERRRMRRAGFTGRVTKVLSKLRDGAHYMRVVSYTLDGVVVPYVELWETHDRARRARIVPLIELVHLVQNVGLTEFEQIAHRRRPGK
jgi:hypothetical protein